MKFYKKYFSLRHWLAFLRRQPTHMQHMYAVTFAGLVTAMLGALILYFDYGFWHERYSRSESTRIEAKQEPAKEVVQASSPGDMMGSFFKEASERIGAIKDIRPLEGKEVYVKERASSSVMSTSSTVKTR
jgi:hypothetical protein